MPAQAASGRLCFGSGREGVDRERDRVQAKLNPEILELQIFRFAILNRKFDFKFVQHPDDCKKVMAFLPV